MSCSYMCAFNNNKNNNNNNNDYNNDNTNHDHDADNNEFFQDVTVVRLCKVEFTGEICNTRIC